MSGFGRISGIRAAGFLLATAAVFSLPERTKTAPIIDRIPAAMVGIWTWGTVNPGRYVNKSTGEYMGHAGGGAVSHMFSADGTYRRYVLIDSGAGFSNESIFSVMEGKITVNESAGTFTLRFTKGNISFEKTSGITRRPLTKEDMERGGTVFTYHLEKDDNGNPILMVNDRGKPAKDGRIFRKDLSSASSGEKVKS